MELYQLRTFAAVAELGSLVQACERLHLSQSAASAQVRALEEMFGVALFERRPNGLVLTRAGSALLSEAQRMLALAAEIAAHAGRLRGQVQGRIRFGSIFDPALTKLGELMSRLIKRNPLIDLEMHHSNSRSVIAGLSAGTLDAGMTLGSNAVAGLDAIVLAKLRYRVVAPISWASRLHRGGWPAMENLPWVSSRKDGPHHQMASELFKRYGIAPTKVIEADSDALIATLVEGGVGLGLIREDLAVSAQASGKLTLLKKGHADTLLRFLYRGERRTEPPITALITLVHELWPTEPDPSRRTKR